MVRLWRGDTTLTAVPLFPDGKVVAGNVVKYATIQCDPGRKEFNSGRLYTQEYILLFTVYSTNRLADAQAISDAIADAFDFVTDTFPEVDGNVLTIIPAPEELAPDPQEQLAKVVHKVVSRWSVKVCQQRS